MRQLPTGMIFMIFFISIIPYVNGAATLSPLRIGADNSNNDITILYMSDGYYLVLKTDIQYSQPSFCFRLRPVSDIDSDSCQLTNTTGNYDCFSYNYDTGNTIKWILSSDYTTISNQVDYSTVLQTGKTIQTIAIPLNGTDSSTSLDFSFLGKSNSIFEMISTGQSSFYQNSDIKLNFVNTFYDSPPFNSNPFSDNLIVQRQWQCFRYGTAYSLLFLGGVVRSSVNTYVISFLSWDSQNITFQMWGGLSYSKDHASRDMVGFEPATGTVTDLFSLYATAPFEDVSSNVGGVQSYTLIASTGASNQKQVSWFYLTTIYRYYDTSDTAGDEVIMFKINNQYCFAAYYDYSLQSLSNSDTLLYTSKSYIHNTFNCFTPDLSLQAEYLKLGLGSGIIALLLFFQ